MGTAIPGTIHWISNISAIGHPLEKQNNSVTLRVILSVELRLVTKQECPGYCRDASPGLGGRCLSPPTALRIRRNQLREIPWPLQPDALHRSRRDGFMLPSLRNTLTPDSYPPLYNISLSRSSSPSLPWKGIPKDIALRFFFSNVHLWSLCKQLIRRY